LKNLSFKIFIKLTLYDEFFRLNVKKKMTNFFVRVKDCLFFFYFFSSEDLLNQKRNPIEKIWRSFFNKE